MPKLIRAGDRVCWVIPSEHKFQEGAVIKTRKKSRRPGGYLDVLVELTDESRAWMSRSALIHPSDSKAIRLTKKDVLAGEAFRARM